MNLGDILKTVGSGLITSMTGGAAPLILAGLNAVLPDDKQLPDNATGQDAQNAIDTLTPEQRASVLEKEYDVEIEQIKQSYGALNTMLEANSKSTHTTRPKIAYQAFQVIAFSTISVISAWCFAVLSGNVAMISKIETSWLFILGVITPLVTVLHAYFGVLRDETKDRFNAAQGHKVDPVSGLIGKLFK